MLPAGLIDLFAPPPERSLVAVPPTEVPALFIKKMVSAFWCWPYNLFYGWFAGPFVVQPVRPGGFGKSFNCFSLLLMLIGSDRYNLTIFDL